MMIRCLKSRLFLQATLPVFTTFNLFLQRDDPQIYILYRQMQCLLKKLLSQFVKPSVIEEHKDCLTEVVYADPANHLHTSQMFIHLTTASQIRKDWMMETTPCKEVSFFCYSILYISCCICSTVFSFS